MLVEERDGKLVRIADRNGHVWAKLAWIGDELDRLDVPGACVRGARIDDPLLGAAHGVGDTTMSALEWLRPTEIPTIAAPARLAPGAGGAILNVIAMLAQRAHIPALRYAGPYPTHALWQALRRSFRTAGSEEAFVAGAVERMARLAREPIPIEFVPAAHERLAIERGHVELRAGVERVVIDGIAYDRDGSPARLIEDRCEVWFGDAPWSRVATLELDGSLHDGPHPVRACTSDVVGKPFPPPLVAAIAELVAEAVSAPLGAGARELLLSRPLVWADLGARAATVGDRVAVHAALWERISPLGLGRLALALAEALVPAVSRHVANELATAVT
ncbi:MAG: hypothetical protein WKG01_14625 [Kofleriaceae bacterium]